jgi:hypothetical protein
MGNNAALDISIALVLLYLLISIMVTVANEMLTTVSNESAGTAK